MPVPLQPENWQGHDENELADAWTPPAASMARTHQDPAVTLPATSSDVPPISAPFKVPEVEIQTGVKDDDVTARLAALKAKLAAKGAATRPATTTPQVPTASQLAPPSVMPTVPTTHMQPDAIQRLQQQLENERRGFSVQLERAREDAAHQAAQVQALRSALDEAEAKAKAAVTASTERLEAQKHEQDEMDALRAEAHAAREKAITEQSRVAALEAQLAEIQAQLERADAAAAAAHDHTIHADLENEISLARLENTTLREELERLRAEAATTRAAAGSPAASFGTDSAFNNKHAEEMEVLRGELAAVQDALSVAESERASAKLQLSRLKTQMLTEQEDEEEKVRWRVEAEVKLALEKMGVGSVGNKAAESARQDQLSTLTERAERAEEEAARWEQTAAARDVELANLQRALGEMSYESDAAVQLRAELRAMQSDVHRLRNELDAARVSVIAAENAVQQVQEERDTARRDTAAAREAEAEAQREVLAARVAAQEAVRELQELRKGGGTLDRVLVLQTLAGIIRFRRPGAALEFAASSLGLTAKEVEEVKMAAKGGASGDKAGSGPSLASSWINFLEAAVNEDGSIPSMVPQSSPQGPK